MKYILLALLPILFFSCKSSMEVTEFQYSRSTQVGRALFSVTKDSIIYTFNGRTGNERKASPTSNHTWTSLKEEVEKIELKKLGDLKSPTNRRQTDASPYGKLFFVTKDSTYQSPDFDGVTAPETLMPIMSLFIELMREK